MTCYLLLALLFVCLFVRSFTITIAAIYLSHLHLPFFGSVMIALTSLLLAVFVDLWLQSQFASFFSKRLVNRVFVIRASTALQNKPKISTLALAFMYAHLYLPRYLSLGRLVWLPS